MMKSSSLIVTIIAWLHIITHVGLFLSDYGQLVHLIDFIVRDDTGTRSDPYNLLPLECIYGALTGLSFGTVGVSFFFAIVFKVGTVQGAAALSAWFHTAWAIHMIWKWNVWRTLIHTDASLQPEMFLIVHIIWTILSLFVIFILSAHGPSKENATTKIKSS